MLFPTVDFALFFLIVLPVSWWLTSRETSRRLFLVAASYFFYGYWDWRFCFLMLLASTTAWAAGDALSKTADPKARKLIVWVGCGLMLVILGFFKYYGFFLETLTPVLEAVGFGRDMFVLQVVLPVGISFFTFQALSYVIDVYRGDTSGRHSLLDILLYISFFPQLVAGPIVRGADFLPQLERPLILTKRRMVFGFALCLLGLLKKMVIANYIAADLVDPAFFDPSQFSSLGLLAAVYGYAVQIYCDFSGYSDIAIGTAALLGYHFKPNFNQPYRAQSLREFWQRWHISLSQWLRDYLYKPLGGNRHGKWATARNLIITMFLGGLWHGAAWTFVLWGLLHGAALVAGRTLGLDGKSGNLAGRILRIAITFHVVCLGWILFRSSSLAGAIDYLTGIAALRGSSAHAVTAFSVALVAATLAAQFLPFRLQTLAAARLASTSNWLIFAGASLCLVIISLISPPGTAPFIYFQF